MGSYKVSGSLLVARSEKTIQAGSYSVNKTGLKQKRRTSAVWTDILCICVSRKDASNFLPTNSDFEHSIGPNLRAKLWSAQESTGLRITCVAAELTSKNWVLDGVSIINSHTIVQCRVFKDLDPPAGWSLIAILPPPPIDRLNRSSLDV